MPARQQRRGIEACDRYVRFSQTPMTSLAFLVIPVLLAGCSPSLRAHRGGRRVTAWA